MKLILSGLVATACAFMWSPALRRITGIANINGTHIGDLPQQVQDQVLKVKCVSRDRVLKFALACDLNDVSQRLGHAIDYQESPAGDCDKFEQDLPALLSMVQEAPSMASAVEAVGKTENVPGSCYGIGFTQTKAFLGEHTRVVNGTLAIGLAVSFRETEFNDIFNLKSSTRDTIEKTLRRAYDVAGCLPAQLFVFESSAVPGIDLFDVWFSETAGFLNASPNSKACAIPQLSKADRSRVLAIPSVSGFFPARAAAAAQSSGTRHRQGCRALSLPQHHLAPPPLPPVRTQIEQDTSDLSK